MRTAFLVLSFLILMAVNANAAQGCSVYVDNTAQKNILAEYAADYLDVSLSKVSATTVSAYSKFFSAEDPVSHCPTSLDTQARVKFVYHPSKNEDCEAEVTVGRSVYIGEEPGISFENVEFTDVEAICATSSVSRITVRPMRPVRGLPPIRPVRPVRP